jgi:hypothetical protein
MTAPFTLLQDDKDPTGVLIRAPVFVTPAGQGEPVFQGAVNISLQTRELLLHALDAVQLDGVAVTVEDLGRADQQPGGKPAPHHLPYTQLGGLQRHAGPGAA